MVYSTSDMAGKIFASYMVAIFVLGNIDCRANSMEVRSLNRIAGNIFAMVLGVFILGFLSGILCVPLSMFASKLVGWLFN